jgi:hypothetical protein
MQKNISKHLIPGAVTLLLLCASACSQQKPAITTGSNVLVPNKMEALSKDALVDSLKQKGTFKGVQTSQIDGQYEIVSTTTNENYFVKANRLVSSSRKPRTKEKSLIYWRMQFRGKAYRERNLTSESVEGHERPMLELACDTLGTGVVYDPSHEEVKRVFYYEAK